jgi:hypothetical protein
MNRIRTKAYKVLITWDYETYESMISAVRESQAAVKYRWGVLNKSPYGPLFVFLQREQAECFLRVEMRSIQREQAGMHSMQAAVIWEVEAYNARPVKRIIEPLQTFLQTRYIKDFWSGTVNDSIRNDITCREAPAGAYVCSSLRLKKRIY